MTRDSDVPALEALRGWLALEPAELLRACVQTPFQGPGPGGQKRNRVYSGVRLSHPGSGLAAEASERREARRNLDDALHRLRLAMALSLPLAPVQGPVPPSPGPVQPVDPAASGSGEAAGYLPVAPPPDRDPSPASAPRIRTDASPRHADFPRFVLEALAALDAAQGRLSPAAGTLGVTASSLTRFLGSEKSVWAKTQAIRKRHGLHPLKIG